MIDNLVYSKEWLIKKIIQTDFKEKETNTTNYIKIKEKALYNLIL